MSMASTEGGVPKRRPARRLPTDTVPPGNPAAELGRSLKIARLRQNLTQDDVSRLTGSTTQYISKVEKGQQNPTFSVLRKIAHAVGQEIILRTIPAKSDTDR